MDPEYIEPARARPADRSVHARDPLWRHRVRRRADLARRGEQARRHRGSGGAGRAVLDNIERCVQSAGCEVADIVKMTIFLKDIRHASAETTVRKRLFAPDRLPVCTQVQVANLGFPELLMEIDVIAHRPPLEAPRTLAHLTVPRSRSSSSASPRVLVPVGSTEQHGAHAPLGTDAILADGGVRPRRAAGRRPRRAADPVRRLARARGIPRPRDALAADDDLPRAGSLRLARARRLPPDRAHQRPLHERRRAARRRHGGERAAARRHGALLAELLGRAPAGAARRLPRRRGGAPREHRRDLGRHGRRRVARPARAGRSRSTRRFRGRSERPPSSPTSSRAAERCDASFPAASGAIPASRRAERGREYLAQIEDAVVKAIGDAEALFQTYGTRRMMSRPPGWSSASTPAARSPTSSRSTSETGERDGGEGAVDARPARSTPSATAVAEAAMARFTRLVHGTTVATNAILERRGAAALPADDRRLRGRARDPAPQPSLRVRPRLAEAAGPRSPAATSSACGSGSAPNGVRCSRRSSDAECDRVVRLVGELASREARSTPSPSACSSRFANAAHELALERELAGAAARAAGLAVEPRQPALARVRARLDDARRRLRAPADGSATSTSSIARRRAGRRRVRSSC